MAITYVLGNPGSGKTYYAVYEIYKYFYPNKEENKVKFKNDSENLTKYEYCYTNINEFKFEEFNNVIDLDFEMLKFHLTNLYNFKVTENKEDSELINYCQDNKIYNTLFVIDEIHNYFNKRDDVLVWWLTYHRHLHHELILITQNLTLVANEYKQIAEFFYKAVDGGKRLFKNKLKYIRFSDYRMYNNSIVEGGAISLKLYPFIFNLYHSGQKSNSKSFVKVYILFGLVFFILAIFLFFYSLSMFAPKNSDNNITKDEIKKITKNNNKEKNKEKEKKLKIYDNYVYEIVCLGNYCYILSNENNYYSIPSSYFYYLLNDKKNKNFIYVFLENSFKDVKKYILISENDVFQKFKKKEYPDEKIINNIDSINSSIF